MADLISMREAAALGIERIRLPIWANPLDHLKIDIVGGGMLGPWIHLFCPFNQICNGRDPVDILWAMGDALELDTNAKSFEPYTGPLPDSDEYRADVERFARLEKQFPVDPMNTP